MSDMNKAVIEEFRANSGKVGGYFENSTLLLLHTTGAKSGKQRLNPLVTVEDGDRLVVAASKAGAPSHPDWYHNVVANSAVEVEYGPDRFQAQAVITEEPERSELYKKLASAFPAFAEYKEKTTRVIPIIALTRTT
ncbi:MAG: nitroreductase family deazaflavin-dependent oxidoreductase [Chloroflexota bacterium]